MKTPRIPTNGAAPFGSNPFAKLDLGPLPDAAPNANAAPQAGTAARAGAAMPTTLKNLAPPARRQPVHLRIEKSGRGGKTVTILHGPGIEALDHDGRQELLHTLKTKLGVGGTQSTALAPNTRQPVPTLEIQGDERPRIAPLLASCGFK